MDTKFEVVKNDKVNLYRINLKTATDDRYKLLEFCLFHRDEQYVAIGWSHVYPNDGRGFNLYMDYYEKVKEYHKRMNAAHNIFRDTTVNDLFWTRDTNGNYWICRAKSGAVPKREKNLDIGAVVPVDAHLVGLDVPGGIKAAFTRPHSGIAQRIYDENLLEYSKNEYNRLSKKKLYEVGVIENENIINNLPDFELEELVISYIQIKYDYYVLSNSIANKSTTPGIECILHSRKKGNTDRIVVQVKGGNKATLKAEDFKSYLDQGYMVFLYAPHCSNESKLQDVVCISKQELIDFYNEYKRNLPESITQWESLLSYSKAK